LVKSLPLQRKVAHKLGISNAGLIKSLPLQIEGCLKACHCKWKVGHKLVITNFKVG
jgi:hypothetical protein